MIRVVQKLDISFFSFFFFFFFFFFNSTRRHFEICFFFVFFFFFVCFFLFHNKQAFTFLCKVSPKEETIYMKCQNLLSAKKKICTKNMKLSADFAQRM